jgi:uncharacterized integral membrane protein
MNIKTFFLLLVLAVVALFAAINWNSFMMPMNLWLLFTSVNAPLGLIMLGVTAVITSLFLIFIAYLQASMLSDTRRFEKEIQAQRKLAEQAEASRINELRNFLESELLKIEQKTAAAESALKTRIDQLDGDLRSFVEQAGNTLAAYIGELEDRLEKKQESGSRN